MFSPLSGLGLPALNTPQSKPAVMPQPRFGNSHHDDVNDGKADDFRLRFQQMVLEDPRLSEVEMAYTGIESEDAIALVSDVIGDLLMELNDDTLCERLSHDEVDRQQAFLDKEFGPNAGSVTYISNNEVTRVEERAKEILEKALFVYETKSGKVVNDEMVQQAEIDLLDQLEEFLEHRNDSIFSMKELEEDWEEGVRNEMGEAAERVGMLVARGIENIVQDIQDEKDYRGE